MSVIDPGVRALAERVRALPSESALRKKSRALRSIWKSIADECAWEASCPLFTEHNGRALGMPDGYGAREAWWRSQQRTHTQHKCTGCHRYAIWKRRPVKRSAR